MTRLSHESELSLEATRDGTFHPGILRIQPIRFDYIQCAKIEAPAVRPDS